MNYCQFRNDFIKRMAVTSGGGLPSIYQQVEYLYGSGYQYIKTDFVPTQRYKIEVDATFERTDSYLWGAIQQVSGKQSCQGIYRRDSGNFEFANPNDANCTNYTWTGITRGDSNRHLFVEDWVTPAYKVDSVTVTPNNYFPSYNYLKFSLFARANNNNPGGNITKAKIYSCKIWDSQLRLINDFVPCYRKADSKPGLFELVTQTFYTNSGSGEFTVGQDVL